MLQAMNIKKSLSPLWQNAQSGVRDPGEARKSRAELRVQRDVEELSYDRFVVGRTVTRVNFPAGTSNLLRCMITICPREGSYDGAEIRFELEIGERYPFCPPRVTCHTRVFHPNIDWRNGNVYLGLLSPSSWKPVLTINTVLFQLQTLFISPGSDLDHACNDEARRLFLMNPGNGACGSAFDTFVRKTLKGGHFFGVKWAPILASPDANGSIPPILSRALSDDPTSVGFNGSSTPRGQRGTRRGARGKRSRDTATELDSSITSGINQLSILPAISPGRQKRRRDREFFPDDASNLDSSGTPASSSTLAKRSRFGDKHSVGVLHQIHALYSSVKPLPQHPQSVSPLLDHERYQQLQKYKVVHGAQENFEPAMKRARQISVTTNGWSEAPDTLSDADRMFHAHRLAHARRSPVFPVNAFGSLADEKNATPSPRPSRNRTTSASGPRPGARSHTSRSPAQRSSLVPLLNSSPGPLSTSSGHKDTENSNFGASILPRGATGNVNSKLRSSSGPDFSMLNIGRQAHSQSVPLLAPQGAGFGSRSQASQHVLPLRETSNFDSGSAFTSATVGGLESSGSAMMDDDESEKPERNILGATQQRG